MFDLPFLYLSFDALHTVTKGDVGKTMLAKLQDKGITGLAFWDNGFAIMSANSPLRAPDDFLGLTLRIQSSKVFEAQINALGAVPQVMAISEVYQALQTGVVGGTENPPSNMFTQKMHEVQKHASVTNHGYLGYAVIVNKQFWDGLPKDVCAGMDKAMVEATDYAKGIAKEENGKALAAMKAAGTTEFHDLTEDERAGLVAALAPGA